MNWPARIPRTFFEAQASATRPTTLKGGEMTMMMHGKQSRVGVKSAGAISAALCLLTMAGCAGMQTTMPTAPVTAKLTLSGSVYGGQQPIKQALLAVYAASTTGYNTANTNLLTSAVTTDSNGGFSVSDDYTCTAGQQIYIVATGGNPGAGTNANIALMAALGDCSTVASQRVTINEVSTVASVYALAPFMSSATTVSTSPTNTSGLAHAFASVRKLANLSTGASSGTTLPAGATAPSATVNTLANVAAACVNSTGVSGDGNGTCAQLFSLTTPVGGSAPTDTLQALLNIAHHPTLNVPQLYDIVPANGPFQPVVSPTNVPNDWTLAVTYSGGALNTPQSTTVDASGNIWITNAGNNTVTVLAQNGTPAPGSPFSGNGLARPTAIAIDANGNGWIANTGAASVSAFTLGGSPITGSPFNGGGNISAPNGVAIDAPGNVWVTNSATGSVTKLSSSGAYLQQVSSGISAPAALVINPN